MEFWRYYGAVRRRWWVPVLIAALALLTVSFIVLNRPGTWASTATLMVRTPGAGNTVLVYAQPGSTGPGLTDQVTLVKTDIATMIASPAFAARVARHFPGGVVPGTYTATSIANTSLLNISGRAATRVEAHRIATTVTDEFLSFYKELNRSDAAESRAFLAQQVKTARARLDGTDNALQQYRSAKGVPALDTQITQAVQTMVQFQVQRDQADVAAREARARVAAAQRALSRVAPTSVSEETLVENPILVQTRTRLTELELQLNELSQIYTDEHPRIVAVKQEIVQLRARLPREVARVVGSQTVGTNPLHQQLSQEVISQTVEYTAALAKRDALTSAFRRVQSQMPQLTTAQRDLASLLREQTAAEEAYTLLSAKLNEAVIKEQQAAYETVSVRVVAAPMVPAAPVPTPKMPLLAAALALGAILGLGTTFFLDYLDGAIRTPAEAERAFGMSVLGVIPTINRRVFRRLTTTARPVWQMASLVLIVMVVAAAIVMLGMRISIAREVSQLWLTLIAL